MRVRRGDLVRYVLWGGLLGTANANRVHFGLPTTWVFHTIGNTLSLMLPEIYGAFAWTLRLDRRAKNDQDDLIADLHHVMRDLVLENPRYVEYVAPAALAYMVSHPKFNIYKGKWAERQVLGFGPDSIPHATTAFALSNGIFDTLSSLRRYLSPRSALAKPVRWADTHAEAISGALLAILTTFYESGEYLIHNAELEATGGDPTKINMEWGVADTVTDVLSNIFGWLLAIAYHHRHTHRYPRRSFARRRAARRAELPL